MTAHAPTTTPARPRIVAGPAAEPTSHLRAPAAPGAPARSRLVALVALLASWVLLLGVVAGVASTGLRDDPAGLVPSPAPGPAAVPRP